ncbi:MAG: hypothetical protein ACOYLB_13125 [Phototrophicaceae bacterium]
MRRLVSMFPQGLLLLVGLINLVRGLAHLLTEDSAATEAGISLQNAGGVDIIYLFAIIGGVQAILAIFYIYTALFDRSHLPIALSIELAKTALNLFIGFVFKPSQATLVVGSRQDTTQLILCLIACVIWWGVQRRAITYPNQHTHKTVFTLN